MTILALHHVQLAMPPGGESRATDFYEGLLGIPRVSKPHHLEARGGCWFESPSVRIHLGVEPGFRPAKRAHPAFLVDDLDGLRQTLEDADVPVTEDEPLPGFDRFYVADPFGNRIEMLSESEPRGPGAPLVRHEIGEAEGAYRQQLRSEIPHVSLALACSPKGEQTGLSPWRRERPPSGVR